MPGSGCFTNASTDLLRWFVMGVITTTTFSKLGVYMYIYPVTGLYIKLLPESMCLPNPVIVIFWI